MLANQVSKYRCCVNYSGDSDVGNYEKFVPEWFKLDGDSEVGLAAYASR